MWLSAHIVYGDDLYGPGMDRLLVSAVAPLVERLQDAGRADFFFVRYADPESHLRLRLKPGPDAGTQELAAEVRAAVKAFAAGRYGAAEATAAPRLLWIDYVPELDRYGGEAGVQVAERHFQLSSQLTLEILAQTQANPSQRLGKALLMSVLLARVFSGGWRPAAAFLRHYSESYLHTLVPPGERRETLRHHLRDQARPESGATDPRAVEGALRSLVAACQTGPDLGVPLLDRWLRGCEASRRELLALGPGDGAEPAGQAEATLARFGVSYLHMHHNRLGLSLGQEIYLTHLCAVALLGLLEELDETPTA